MIFKTPAIPVLIFHSIVVLYFLIFHSRRTY
jgi:hypothetical protein